MKKYYLISSFMGAEGHYAAKLIKSIDELKIDSKKFNFTIDQTKILYIGVEADDSIHYDKIELFLSRYKTKTNKHLYKIDLMTILGRVAHGNDTIFLDDTISKEALEEAISLEKKRLARLQNRIELSGSAKSKILEKYQSVEKSWLSYWQKSKVRLEAFYQEHPPPRVENYCRGFFSSLVFGKFDKNSYDTACSEQARKIDWLCSKIAGEAAHLRTYFSATCPAGCGEKIDFQINFEEEKLPMTCIGDKFSHGIYKRLYDVSGICSECGSFTFAFDDEYTCICRNYFPEYIEYIIKKVMRDSIAYSIEEALGRVKN
jgi:hypothetical protein